MALASFAMLTSVSSRSGTGMLPFSSAAAAAVSFNSKVAISTRVHVSQPRQFRRALSEMEALHQKFREIEGEYRRRKRRKGLDTEEAGNGS